MMSDNVCLYQAVDGVVEWMSVLEVRRVTEADYTHYTCTATNTQGKHTYTLALTPPVPPAPPTHLVVSLSLHMLIKAGCCWLLGE